MLPCTWLVQGTTLCASRRLCICTGNFPCLAAPVVRTSIARINSIQSITNRHTSLQHGDHSTAPAERPRPHPSGPGRRTPQPPAPQRLDAPPAPAAPPLPPPPLPAPVRAWMRHRLPSLTRVLLWGREPMLRPHRCWVHCSPATTHCSMLTHRGNHCTTANGCKSLPPRMIVLVDIIIVKQFGVFLSHLVLKADHSGQRLMHTGQRQRHHSRGSD